MMLLAVALLQSHTYKSDDGNLLLKFDRVQFKLLNGGVQRYVMAGSVDVSSLSQGLRLSADRETALFASKGSETAFRRLEASGSVRLAKSVKSPGGQRQTVITGTKGDYQVGATESVAKLDGPVRLVDTDSASKQLMIITGSSGTAWVVSGATAKASPLRAVELNGPVAIDIDQATAGGKGKAGKVHATGDHLSMDARGSAPVIKLTGHVAFSLKQGTEGGSSSGFSQLIMNLTQNGELSSIQGGNAP